MAFVINSTRPSSTFTFSLSSISRYDSTIILSTILGILLNSVLNSNVNFLFTSLPGRASGEYLQVIIA